MLDIVQQLIDAKLQAQENPGASVTISLDLNDPDVQKLAKFAKKLMLPTTRIRKSGLVTKTGMAIPERAEDFIDALRKLVGNEIIEELQDDLSAQLAVQQRQQDQAVLADSLNEPASAAKMLDGALHNASFRSAMAPGQAEKFGNMTQAMQRGELPLKRDD